MPASHFQLAYSQSCWSHVSLYDQYLYLRDLRKVIAYDGVFLVNGIFTFGGNIDWCFDRFRRRVHQNENNIEGVYHEFTGIDVLAELAVRLGWEIVVFTPQAFILRFKHNNKDIMHYKWADVPADRKVLTRASSLADFFAGKVAKRPLSFMD